MFDDYADNAIAALRAGLDAALDAIETAKADGLTLKRPNDDGASALGTAGVAYSTGVHQALSWPWVEVAVIDTIASEWSIGQATAKLAPNVILRVTYQDPDLARLDAALKRYGWAVLQVLGKPDAFGRGVCVDVARVQWRTNPEFDGQEVLTGQVVAQFTLDDQLDVV